MRIKLQAWKEETGVRCRLGFEKGCLEEAEATSCPGNSRVQAGAEGPQGHRATGLGFILSAMMALENFRLGASELCS